MTTYSVYYRILLLSSFFNNSTRLQWFLISLLKSISSHKHLVISTITFYPVSTEFFLSCFFCFYQLLSQHWGSTICGAQFRHVMEPESLGHTHSIFNNIQKKKKTFNTTNYYLYPFYRFFFSFLILLSLNLRSFFWLWFLFNSIISETFNLECKLLFYDHTLIH